ncbi:probable ATP-dependent RNA helicase DHX58 isoform X2 [Haliotis rufescens]|uniref:probable ATP-dependent RNA helicase DHX58 isoform X2 n=1 Tax=Haliotis rufescens TaxID=6454 RepID=UPI00201F27C5|nr:probable ATP-dependent RNA helicase DHX58 isoform X2 [Haliotis rufescens]
MAAAAAAVPEDLKKKGPTLEDQVFMIEIMMDTFEKYLDPSLIIDKIKLPDLKEEIEGLQNYGKRSKAAKKLVKAILKDPQERVPFFLLALREVGFKHFINILDDRAENKDMDRASEKYDLLLKLLQGDLVKKIIPSEIVMDLVPILNSGDEEEINAIEDRRGANHACRHMFRCMRRKDPHWPVKFMDVLHNNNPRLHAKLDPERHDDNESCSDDDDNDDGGDDDDDDSSIATGAESLASSVSQTNPKDVYVAPVEMSREDRLRDLESMLHPPSDGPPHSHATSEPSNHDGSAPEFSDEEKQDDEDDEKDSADTAKDDPLDLNLRRYQLELAENAVKRRNTIICAPTGSGKTRVALYIVKDHLEKQDEAEADVLVPGKKRVVFLARTVPLVNQQYGTFQRFFGQDYRIFKLSGEDESSMYLHQLLDLYDIFVMTPQILENQLRDAKIKSLSVFSLIVLDECHHTRKGEPYNKLMIRYLKQKSKKKSIRLPQIVGLTASLGVEKATVDEEAIDSILKLCANMDAPYLSTVQTHIEELKEKVPVPNEKTYPLTEDRKDPARKELENAMEKIEDLMIEINDLNDKAIDNLLMKRPSNRNSQPYGQWAVQMKNESRLVHTGRRDGLFTVDVDPKRAEMARSLFVMADHIFKYNAALEIHDIVRIKDVVDYLQKEFSHGCHSTQLPGGGSVHVPCEEKLDEIFSGLKKKLIRYEQKRRDDPKYDNPNLKVLAKTLTEMLDSKGSDSRAIIFVRTRATCYALTNWLNEDDKIDPQLKDLKAMAFTGAGANEEEGGMTQNEQDKVISKFKSGQVKLIVATSVAEEGLDIPECNIVVKYNHVGNEITTLQTRGRSRKAGGTSILLGGSKVQQKEMLNVARAGMMQRAITTIRGMPMDRVKRRIDNNQAETLAKEAIQEEVRRHQTRQKLDTKFTLMCACCRKLCAHSKDLRIINGSQHVVISRDFEDRINTHQFRNQKKPFDGITMTGSMQCRNCHKPWGVKFIYQGVAFPSLGIKYFIVINEETKQPQYYKKWLELPYQIQDISAEDFKTLLGTENVSSSDEDDDYDEDDEFGLC